MIVSSRLGNDRVANIFRLFFSLRFVFRSSLPPLFDRSYRHRAHQVNVQAFVVDGNRIFLPFFPVSKT